MKKLGKVLLTVLLLAAYGQLFAQGAPAKFKYDKTINFTPYPINDSTIDWGYLTVPENWHVESKKIKIAVVILKSTSKSSKNAVVFLPGGPGRNSIDGMGMWMNHPIRKENDIILMDLRGTGYSQPNLCPDLGTSFAKILAEDYNFQEEISARLKYALECRDELLERKIDISGYNSINVSFDIHALKESLGYSKWMVYGVSYGTRMALEYGIQFPDDVHKVVLDSPVLPTPGLYDNNTVNFMRSLSILFKECSEDPGCSKEYGDLESVFYNVIRSLKESPITINVSKEISPNGKFTLNAQDFLIAIQQSLYIPALYEVLPLMIKEFDNKNTNMLSALVPALVRKFSLDYGVFYCVLCDETLPLNDIKKFESNSSMFSEEVASGLSFYKGDYFICDKWFAPKTNLVKSNFDSIVPLKMPSLIVTGELDPVTPPLNGEKTQKYFVKSNYYEIKNKGHVPSFDKDFREGISSFLSESGKSTLEPLSEIETEQVFYSNVLVNGGINKFAIFLFEKNLWILIPLCFSVIIFLIVIFYLSIKMLRKKRDSLPHEKLINIGMMVVSAIGIIFSIGIVLATHNTGIENAYILAFGVLDKYTPLLFLPFVFLLLFSLLILNLLKSLNFKKVTYKTIFIVASVIFLSEVFYLKLYIH